MSLFHFNEMKLFSNAFWCITIDIYGVLTGLNGIMTGLILYDLMSNKFIHNIPIANKNAESIYKGFNIKLQSLPHLLTHVSLHTVTGTTAIKAMYFKSAWVCSLLLSKYNIPE